tara:strand:- start:1018 stop:1311 length:294 start_codon:yes stop_codon:yes gene_type:complete
MRINAVIVDAEGNIKHTVTKMRMLHDLVEVSYVSVQSINNGCFCTSSVFVSDEGDDRVFSVDTNSNVAYIEQIKNPKTYEEMGAMKEFVSKFNGYKK